RQSQNRMALYADQAIGGDAREMNAAVLDQVRRIASELFDVPLSQLTADSSPATVESWDSVQHLNLVLEMEQTFGVHFEPDEMEQMQSLGAIAEMVAGKQS